MASVAAMTTVAAMAVVSCYQTTIFVLIQDIRKNDIFRRGCFCRSFNLG